MTSSQATDRSAQEAGTYTSHKLKLKTGLDCDFGKILFPQFYKITYWKEKNNPKMGTLLPKTV